MGQFVKGMAHTNGAESFWATLKRGYKDTYHKMSEKHLERYAPEFAGRYNIQHLDTLDQMSVLVKGMNCKALLYKVLIQ